MLSKTSFLTLCDPTYTRHNKPVKVQAQLAQAKLTVFMTVLLISIKKKNI